MNPLSSWMFFLRSNPEYVDRFVDCFWPSQILSKEAAIELLTDLEFADSPVYIFGGWYGVFAQMLYHKYPNKYYSIDIDPKCELVIEGIQEVCKHIIHIEEPNIIPVTADMSKYEYPEDPYLVINTSTEHLTQQEYNKWWNNIPSHTKYFIQGNNFFESDEHIRCTDSLEEFLRINNAVNSKNKQIECGMRPDGRPFYRFMALGIKQ